MDIHDTDATRLLGLDGLAVLRVEHDALGLPVAHLVTVDPGARACLGCGVLSTSLKERTRTRPRDGRVGGRPVRLVWHKARWRCREPRCERGSFTEQVGQVPARARITARLREEAARAVADGGRVVSEAAASLGLSWPTVHQAFAAVADAEHGGQPPRVQGLGIDETRRGKPTFRLDEATGTWVQVSDRWHVGFVDLGGRAGLVGQVEGRSAAAVAGWLRERPEQWRQAVRTVAIDLCPAFRAAVAEVLPHAVIVADRFHVVALANKAVTLVRRRETWALRGRRGRKSDPEWGIKRLLTCNLEDLSRAKLAKLWNTLIDLGDHGERILTAWIAKNTLRDLLALTDASGVAGRHTISHRLWRFLTWCADSGIAEIEALARTIDAWWPQIEAAITTKTSNAVSEGTNRVIKLEGRKAYGFRNPANQRRRSRCATTRRNRQAPVPAQAR